MMVLQGRLQIPDDQGMGPARLRHKLGQEERCDEKGMGSFYLLQVSCSGFHHLVICSHKPRNHQENKTPAYPTKLSPGFLSWEVA